jgi:hypothetical protein
MAFVNSMPGNIMKPLQNGGWGGWNRESKRRKEQPARFVSCSNF